MSVEFEELMKAKDNPSEEAQSMFCILKTLVLQAHCFCDVQSGVCECFLLLLLLTWSNFHHLCTWQTWWSSLMKRVMDATLISTTVISSTLILKA